MNAEEKFLQLKPYTEIVGTLMKVKNEGNNWILFLNLQNEVVIPKASFTEDQLVILKGKRVGIFRYGENDYTIRQAKKRNIDPKVKKNKNVFSGGEQYSVFRGKYGTTIMPWDKKKDKQEEVG
jgi:hypothetical protein